MLYLQKNQIELQHMSRKLSLNGYSTNKSNCLCCVVSFDFSNVTVCLVGRPHSPPPAERLLGTIDHVLVSLSELGEIGGGVCYMLSQAWWWNVQGAQRPH